MKVKTGLQNHRRVLSLFVTTKLQMVLTDVLRRVHGNTGMDTGTDPNVQWNGPVRTGMDTRTDRNGCGNGPELTPERTGMDTGTDQNGHGNGPEWTPERTRMDTGTDRNGPEDTMKSLALHPLFDIRIEKSLNIFT